MGAIEIQMTKTGRRRMMRKNILILCGLVFLASGCGTIAIPPPTAPMPPREEVAVQSYKFRAAVGDFTDQTGLAGDLVKTIPDILTTTLFKLGRIEMYERTTLRGLSPQESGSMIDDLLGKGMIDGVISGTITRIDGNTKEVVVELRLLGRNKAVMYADHQTMRFEGRRVMEVNRDDVGSLAKAISDAIPTVKPAKILSKSGERITLDAGSDDGLIAGLSGTIQAPLDLITDPDTGEIPRPTYVIVGEMVVDQVSKNSAIGRILAGEDIRPDDMVQFK
jgi:hypothetical protein